MNWRDDARRGWNDREPWEHREKLSNFASAAWRGLYFVVFVLVLGGLLDIVGVIG